MLRISVWQNRVVILFILHLCLVIGGNAQGGWLPHSGTLIYVRNTDGGRQFVRRDASSEQAYTLPRDKCTAISTQGNYISTTSLQREDMVIRRLDMLETVAEISWKSEWEPCAMVWGDDTTVAIAGDTGSTTFQYNPVTGSFEAIVVPSIMRLSYPDLPGRFPTSDANFLLESPNGQHVLYEKCVRSNYDPADGDCMLSVEFVVYDVTGDEVVRVLEDADQTLVTGHDSLNRLRSVGSTAWSPDGNYLAYPIYGSINDRFNLMIYHLETNTVYKPDFIRRIEPDWWMPLEWSPDGTNLVFWFQPGELFGDLTPSLDVRAFAILNVFTDEYTLPNQTFEAPLPSSVTWSPESSGFIFVDGGGVMHYVDRTTAMVTIVDQGNISRVVSWNPSE